MAFSQKKILIVIALTIISLVGVIIVQFFWIDAAFETQQDQFNSRVYQLDDEIEKSLENDRELRSSIIEYASDNGNHQNHGSPSEKERIETKLQAMIDSVFNEHGLNTRYEFGLVRHLPGGVSDENEILLSSANLTNPSLITDSRYKSCTSELAGLAHINLYFPDKDFYIAKQIGGMLGLSVLFILIIVGCFSYTILTIRKQKRLADMKNDFINNMTHEFKTPIFSISLASKALGKSDKIQQSDKMSNYLNLIRDENSRLKNQVDKVLQMALIDSESFQLERREVDLHKLIQQVTNSFELAVRERNGLINLHLDADKHFLYADETHLSNIIYNLIDNAVKYSREIPEITISTTDMNEGIRFSVKDNGIGMDMEAQKYIFDKFYRAQSGDIHDVKGFGLGLSYVKNIVDAHKGWIKLKSKINSGSEFTIFLPTSS